MAATHTALEAEDAMNVHVRGAFALALVAGAAAASAQTLPPVRPIGPLLATSAEPMVAVSQVRALPGGRVLVNDNTGRRVLLFDSTLTHFTIVADTTAATAHAYGATIGGLIPWHGDSTLFVDPALLAMLVIDANGKVVRTLAAPNPNEVNFLIGGPYGTPGLDQQGRLVYKARVGGFGKIIPAPVPGQPPPPDIPDSGMVVRFDLVTRKVDTVAKFVVPSFVFHISREDGWTTATTIVNPIPWTDDWALLADGSVAIVHGREFGVDMFDAKGTLARTAKLPFDWERLNDADKTAVLDSAERAMKAANPDIVIRSASSSNADTTHHVLRRLPPPDATVPRNTGVAGGRPINASRVTEFVSLDEMPDYRPAFRLAAARGDADGNLWIRTTKIMDGGAVYDVVNRQGALIDRIQVPPGRVIAGFGPGGVVYMGVLDGTTARIERAQLHSPTHP